MHQKLNTKQLTLCGLMGGLSAALMFFRFPLPFMPPFMDFDFSGLVEIIGGFTMGALRRSGNYYPENYPENTLAGQLLCLDRRTSKLYVKLRLRASGCLHLQHPQDKAEGSHRHVCRDRHLCGDCRIYKSLYHYPLLYLLYGDWDG